MIGSSLTGKVLISSLHLNIIAPLSQQIFPPRPKQFKPRLIEGLRIRIIPLRNLLNIIRLQCSINLFLQLLQRRMLKLELDTLIRQMLGSQLFVVLDVFIH